jgi:hypothetical protein
MEAFDIYRQVPHGDGVRAEKINFVVVNSAISPDFDL